MADNYVLLETIELTQDAATVTFDNIPQTGYTDLKVVCSTRATTGNNQYMFVQINSLTSQISGRILYGASSTASSYSVSSVTYLRGDQPDSGFTANTFANTEFYFPNYNSTTTHKSVLMEGISEGNSTTVWQIEAGSFVSANNAAISSLTFSIPNTGSFAQYSTFSLYGVAALGTTPIVAPKATGGNTISNDGTYWIHTFTSSGTFVPQTDLTCDYLVVAGGGSGAGVSDACGGGGAGGMLTSVGSSGGGGSAGSALSLTANSYTVTVGAGGPSYSGPDSWGISGSNSIFSSITAIGGGGGGKPYTNNGLNGGSGGGQGWGDGAPGNGTSGQGYAGGISAGSGYGYSAGGGGGAGSVGYSASTSNGGNGLSNSITGTSVTYAGGGGGGRSSSIGSGGSGIGGNGGNPSTKPTAGAINTGSGGGGSRTDAGVNQYAPSGAGGSGIVIIRYAM